MVVEELKANSISFEGISKMNVLQSCIKETFRLSTVLLLATYSKKELNYKGYQIKKNSSLFISPRIFMQDPNLFPEPTEFKPKRFCPFSKDNGEKDPHVWFIPGGVGKWKCPGVEMSVVVIATAIGALLKEYHCEFSKLPGATEEIVIPCPSGPVGLKYKKRDWEL